jgi:hypothetical protein
MKTTKFYLSRAADVAVPALAAVIMIKCLMLLILTAYTTLHIEHTLARLDGPEPSMETTRALMRQAFHFAYPRGKNEAGARLPADPAVTEATRSGDCKDRAWWLASRLNDSDLIFAAGKYSATDTEGHAWLFWKKDGQLWILDPIYFTAPVRASKLRPAHYIVETLYTKYGTFGADGSYHAVTDLL